MRPKQWKQYPGLTSIHRKGLSYNSIQQKSLSYKSIHQVYGENACHTIFIHFRKTIEKIKPFLRLFEINWTDWWQKNWFKIFFFEKMLSIQFPYMEIVWLAFFESDTKNLPQFFENLPQNFFFQPQFEFCTQTNIFRKKKFLHAKFNFFVHNVVLDTIILAFFPFLFNFFSKTLKFPYFFFMACLWMPWSMTDSLKNQKFKIFITEKFCQKLKVCYFWYIFCERHVENKSGSFLCIVIVRPSKLWCFEWSRSLSPIIQFPFMFIKEFSYNFLFVGNCMKLYEKKFSIYENCMISIFGQPGMCYI